MRKEKWQEKKEKKNYVGRETLPTSIKEKEPLGDTLAQKSRESPPPQVLRRKRLMWIWRVTRSTRL
eukprot:1154161-Pelagomonas_calceolata.AAC.4